MASLAISYDRAEYMDFTQPYEYSGFHLVQGRPRRKVTLIRAIFAPLQDNVWAGVIVSWLVAAFIFYVLGEMAAVMRERTFDHNSLFYMLRLFFGQMYELTTPLIKHGQP